MRITLSLDTSSIERARAYCEMRGTSISRLVDDFLAALPMEALDRSTLSPTVRRLLGIAATQENVSLDDYGAHLEEKYLA